MLFELSELMKVALISQEGGGISSVSFGLGMSLARRKIDTTIFTGAATFGTTAVRTEKPCDYLQIIRLPIPDMPPRNLWFQILNFSNLSKLLSQFTVIHGVSPFSSFALNLLQNRSNQPFVTTIHSTSRSAQKVFLNQPLSSWTLRDVGFHLLEFPLYDFSEKRGLLNSDHAVVCSYTLLSQLAAYRKMNLERTSVIHNGVDFDEIDKVEPLLNNKQDIISIVYAGRLFPMKGVMYLLEAFKLLRRVFKNVHLSIFGKGPLQERITQFVADSNLGDCVSSFGHVSHKRLLAEIKKSDIVVFPSLLEAQSMFMLEAMACRKPLLAFDLPFAREIVTNMETGVLAAPRDIEDLYRKIELLVTDEKLRHRLGNAAYNYVRRNHNWDIQVEKYLKVYESLIRRSR
jgi:glycosyltransferase involved in cell wall biosynthesis